MLRYAPQLSIDKDVAGAYVIGRRALGFKEDTPENYEKLLKDKAYLECREFKKAINQFHTKPSERVKLLCSLANSEGSPPLPYPRKGLAKGPFSSEASAGGRDVG